MNRYPLWKYAVMLIALLVGLVYTLPNLFGEAPAVQVSSGKVTVKVDPSLAPRIEEILAKAGLKPDFVQYDGNSVKARFADLDAQRKAKDAIGAALNPDPSDPTYIVALNLLSRSPRWLTALHALPMYLGLDLRGGVHFLMQVDMKAALTKKADSTAGDVRTLLRDKNIRHTGITRDGNAVVVRFRDQPTLAAARTLLLDQLTDFDWVESQEGADWKLAGNLKPDAAKRVQSAAITQNITTLHNRVNELGVAEPVIQQQGADRVVVQLPGVQDTAKAKDIIGRTATLEMRMVDDSSEARLAETGARPGAVRLRALRRARRPAGRRQAPGADHRREPHRRAARLRRPEPGARGAPHGRRDAARASCATSRARTSASGWRSCCSRRARARSSPRRSSAASSAAASRSRAA